LEVEIWQTTLNERERVLNCDGDQVKLKFKLLQDQRQQKSIATSKLDIAAFKTVLSERDDALGRLREAQELSHHHSSASAVALARAVQQRDEAQNQAATAVHALETTADNALKMTVDHAATIDALTSALSDAATQLHDQVSEMRAIAALVAEAAEEEKYVTEIMLKQHEILTDLKQHEILTDQVQIAKAERADALRQVELFKMKRVEMDAVDFALQARAETAENERDCVQQEVDALVQSSEEVMIQLEEAYRHLEKATFDVRSAEHEKDEVMAQLIAASEALEELQLHLTGGSAQETGGLICNHKIEAGILGNQMARDKKNTLLHIPQLTSNTPHTATHYSTLQHTATHCNTLHDASPHIPQLISIVEQSHLSIHNSSIAQGQVSAAPPMPPARSPVPSARSPVAVPSYTSKAQTPSNPAIAHLLTSENVAEHAAK